MGLDNRFIIYKYTSPSGGVYIGQTCKTLEGRAGKNGCNYLAKDKISGKYLQPGIAHAIIKYGWDNIKKEILFENLTSSQANEKEIQLIKKYKSGGKCYNISDGGNGLIGTRDRKIKQYKLSGEFVKEWDSIKEASEFLGNPKAQANISACCSGKKYRAYNFIWRYSDDKLEVKPLQPYRCSIDQFNKQGDYICTYCSIAEASKSTGIGDTSIGNCLRGRSRSAGGYMWRFKQIT